jgi:hypothetical protein
MSLGVTSHSKETASTDGRFGDIRVRIDTNGDERRTPSHVTDASSPEASARCHVGRRSARRRGARCGRRTALRIWAREEHAIRAGWSAQNEQRYSTCGLRWYNGDGVVRYRHAYVVTEAWNYIKLRMSMAVPVRRTLLKRHHCTKWRWSRQGNMSVIVIRVVSIVVDGRAVAMLMRQMLMDVSVRQCQCRGGETPEQGDCQGEQAKEAGAAHD